MIKKHALSRNHQGHCAQTSAYRILLSYPPMSNNFIQTILSVINTLRNITLYVIFLLSILITSLTDYIFFSNKNSLESLRYVIFLPFPSPSCPFPSLNNSLLSVASIIYFIHRTFFTSKYLSR